MAHRHDGHHRHGPAVSGRRLLWVTLLNFLVTAAEMVGGLLSSSLSLLSDAVHNLGDALSLALAYAARKVGGRKASLRYTFGYQRAEIVAAFVNAAVLVAICLFLLKEAWDRWQSPGEIDGGVMLTFAVIGLAANLFSVLILQKEKGRDLNTRAAYLHLLGDTLSSVAVIAGAAAILLWRLFWLDPLITVLVSLYILWHAWGVLREATDILMQSAPEDLDVPAVIEAIERLDGVRDVHHLHLWRLNESQVHFEAHVTVPGAVTLSEVQATREAIRAILEAHGISHSTLQMEAEGCAGCGTLLADEGR